MGINMFKMGSGSASGGAGVATSNETSTVILAGKILSIYVQYNDSPPVTTDVTVATQGTNSHPPAITVLTLTNANTSGYFYPRAQVQDLLGGGVTYDGTNEVYEPVAIHDKIVLTIAGANDGDSVDCWILMEC